MRDMILQAGSYRYEFPRPTLVMGIVNVTPDSFSDGGMYYDPAAAEEHALRLVEEGADLVDIGGESTRPTAQPVPEREELRRVLPVIERLAGKILVPLSIDTQKAGVARAAVAAGASLVNDIGAKQADPAMGRLVAETGAGYVIMHMQGTPQTMQINPTYQNVINDVGDFFAFHLGRLRLMGVREEQTLLDVGIGFGKTVHHNLELLGGLRCFKKFNRPLLLGVSRKSFMGHLLKLEVAERLPAALACACWGMLAGVAMIRTHDVAPTVRALRMIEALAARQQPD
jgi:dihydropteroate synthase